jgi:hypothetical protein
MSKNKTLTHWEWLVAETEFALKAAMIDDKTGIDYEDIKLIINTLKDNVPFIENNIPFYTNEES